MKSRNADSGFDGFRLFLISLLLSAFYYNVPVMGGTSEMGACACLMGVCNVSTGACISCDQGWVGPYCDVCDSGYYGPNCLPCIDCQNGACSDSSTGNGSCICHAKWETDSNGACTVCEYGYYISIVDNVEECGTVELPTPPPTSSYKSTTGLSTSSGIIIGVVIAGAVVLVLLLSVAYVVYRRHQNHTKLGSQTTIALDNRSSFTSRRAMNPDDLNSTMINTRLEVALPGFLRLDFESQVRAETTFGVGGSGTIATGALLDVDLVKKYNTSKVALKFVNGIPKLSEEENRQLFNREVSIMWSLSFNENIALLIGYTENPPCIILKLYDYDLYSMLHVNKIPITLKQKIAFFKDIAHALASMHELNICHRDIKTANVLIDEGKEKKKAVICDFGLAAAEENRFGVGMGAKETHVQGFSPRYAAPEVFAKAHAQPGSSFSLQIGTEKAGDVYAFGVIIWEVLVEKIPWDGRSLEDIEMEVRQGNRPSPLLDSNGNEEIDLLNGLARKCWSSNPKERPTATDIQSKLDFLTGE